MNVLLVLAIRDGEKLYRSRSRKKIKEKKSWICSLHWKVYILCLTQMTLCNHFQFKHSRAIALLGDAFARFFSILIWISQIFANRNEFVWRFRLTSSHDKRAESTHLRPFTQQWWHFTLNFMARIKIASNLAEFYCLQGAKASVHFGLEQDHHHHHTRGARSDGRGMRSLKITLSYVGPGLLAWIAGTNQRTFLWPDPHPLTFGRVYRIRKLQ